MKEETIIIILLILIVSSLIITRLTLRRKYIKDYGFYYNKIKELNDIFELKWYINRLEIHKSYKSKSGVEKSKLEDLATQYVGENLAYIEQQIQEYENGENQYIKYKKLANKILEKKINYCKSKISSLLFFSLDDFTTLENKMVENILFENKNIITLYVYVDYTSPHGRNYWCKDFEYSYKHILQFIEIAKKREEYIKSAKYQRQLLSSSLRYDVLKRDNFTCQLCGANVKDDGVKLEVDHIFPVSKGGKTEMDNLQTLCERCNRGKSDKY